MKIYALQSKKSSSPNVFLSQHPSNDYLILAEYEVDITLPSDEVARKAYADYWDQDKQKRVEWLKEELRQLEGAA